MYEPRAHEVRNGVLLPLASVADGKFTAHSHEADIRGARIGDVAARAGVSAGTVSRALRGMPNVSEETRARVLAAASELSYIASPSASSLASGRMSTIGVVTPFISEWFFAQVVGGIEEELRGSGFDLVLYLDIDGRLLMDLPMRRRVDGMLLLTIPPDTPDVGDI